MKKYLLPLVLFNSLMGTAVYSQVFRAGGSSGTACPSGAQYKGNGFCRSNDGKQYFPAGGSSGSACPSGSQYKGNGFCKSNNYKQFFCAGGSHQVLSTREMGFVEATNQTPKRHLAHW